MYSRNTIKDLKRVQEDITDLPKLVKRIHTVMLKTNTTANNTNFKVSNSPADTVLKTLCSLNTLSKINIASDNPTLGIVSKAMARVTGQKH